MNRIFLLSPAHCNGLRARHLLRKNSRSELAQRLRDTGVPLGELFSFLSALYFRGKLSLCRSLRATAGRLPGDFNHYADCRLDALRLDDPTCRNCAASAARRSILRIAATAPRCGSAPRHWLRALPRTAK